MLTALLTLEFFRGCKGISQTHHPAFSAPSACLFAKMMLGAPEPQPRGSGGWHACHQGPPYGHSSIAWPSLRYLRASASGARPQTLWLQLCLAMLTAPCRGLRSDSRESGNAAGDQPIA